jgi:uncharacterized SAM-binding protein YcdF (DUF218 family)
MSTLKRPAAGVPFDAIVVLASGINPQGEIPPFVQKRVKEAVKASHNTTPIIMSGLWSYLISYTPPRSEASAMKAFALTCAAALDPEKIKLEEASMDCLGNAYFSKVSFLEPRNWRNLLLVTSDFHIARASYVFRKVLGKDYAVTLRAVSSGFSAEELKAKAILEDKLLALTKHFIDPVKDGDTAAIRSVMDNFPGYSTSPKYTQADLLDIIDIGIPVVDTYGIKQS